MHLEAKYFWRLSYNHWVFLVIIKLLNPLLQDNGIPKRGPEAELIIFQF